jgi:hypothetical protein
MPNVTSRLLNASPFAQLLGNYDNKRTQEAEQIHVKFFSVEWFVE